MANADSASVPRQQAPNNATAKRMRVSRTRELQHTGVARSTPVQEREGVKDAVKAASAMSYRKWANSGGVSASVAGRRHFMTSKDPVQKHHDYADVIRAPEN